MEIINAIKVGQFVFDSSGGFSSEYQAVLDRGTALAYSLPSGSQQIKQNQLVTDLISADLWDDLDVLWVYANDGGADFATLNWKSPTTFQCTRVNSPTFTTNVGFKSNGSTSYVDTNWIPSTNGVNYTQNNAMMCVSVDNFGSLQFPIGVYDGANSSNLLHHSGNPQYVVNGNSNVVADFGDAAGVYITQRLTSSTMKLTLNTTDDSDKTHTSVTSPSMSIFVLARNNVGSPILFNTNNVRIALLGKSLDSTKRTALYNALNTYITGL